MPLDDATQELVRNKLLGWGAACAPVYPGMDIGQDIVFADGDLAIVKGLSNLGQDLTVALTTGLSADPFNTNFGFDGINAMVEESNPMMVRERVRVSVITLLNKDPRVRRILDVKLLDGRLGPLSADVEADADIATKRTLNVRVAFETVSGDQSALDLGGVKLNV
ncbi:hypothetical protein [Fimbriimonas ginsengisoli]|uniref:Bacteriophage protein n=1 Tax=Fimbriimonas ginsengisoli Gsoil 348 TaxID=661478 RepID=A0A068NSI2_FIMGI|nr:hypothetical protein [Fimbriimonas ginsengisoli]AIE86498.1 hypothetical protein OP10G_3130 [Fimbriimonas ginsengisoli Gsoil 348]